MEVFCPRLCELRAEWERPFRLEEHHMITLRVKVGVVCEGSEGFS